MGAVLRGCPGQAKVENLHDAVRRDFDIGRFQIAVNDALFMRRLERVCHLSRNEQSFSERDRSARDSFGQRLAVDQLEH